MSRAVSRSPRMRAVDRAVERMAPVAVAVPEGAPVRRSVGVRGPVEAPAFVVADDVRALREMACAAYEMALADICSLCLPIADQNALVIATIRRKEAMLAAIGGVS